MQTERAKRNKTRRWLCDKVFVSMVPGVLTSILLVGLAAPAHAQNSDPVETARLLAGDGAVDDHLGHSVSLNGETAVVGSPGNDEQGNQPGEASPEIVKGDLGRELDTLLTHLAPWGFHGSVLVARDDEIVLQKGYGLADRKGGIANTPDTLYEIASVTKHLTAAAVLLLEQEGVLSTDDSITKWLPGVPDEHKGVTIYHLLTHTSGFPRMGPTGRGDNDDDALRDYLAGGRVREPGARHEYWNGGYALLAMIIERASGQSYQEFCHDRMFRPAGMSAAGFCQEPFDERLMAHGYDGDQDVGAASSHSYGWEYKGMGGIVTSVVDLYHWDHAMREGRLLRDPAAKLERAFLSGYACGTWVETTSRQTPLLMIGGNVKGFNSMVWRLPEDDAVVIVLCNNPQNSYFVGTHLLRRLFDSPGIISMPPKIVEIDQEHILGFCGSFRGDAGTLEISQRGNNGVDVRVYGQPLVQLFMNGSMEMPPALRKRIEDADRVMRGVAGGDFEPLREMMAPKIPSDWPVRFRAYWNKKVAERGELVSYELLGTRGTTRGPSSLRVLYRLHHERTVAYAELILMGDRLSMFDLDAEGVVVEFKYVPLSPTTIGSYSMYSEEKRPVIEMSETGDAVIRAANGTTLTFRRE
jgi:CubicO group peptidase (beta-lactamase class C family)